MTLATFLAKRRLSRLNGAIPVIKNGEENLTQSAFVREENAKNPLANYDFEYAKKFVLETQKAIENGIAIWRTFDSDITLVKLFGTEQFRPKVCQIDLCAKRAGSLHLRMLDAGSLRVENRESWGSITIQRCNVGIIHIFGKIDFFIITDSHVRFLILEDNCEIRTLSIRDSYVVFFRCSSSNNPFLGDVRIENTYFERNLQSINPSASAAQRRDEYFVTGMHVPQHYRNARLHLTERGNARAAGIFHAVEMSHERKIYGWDVSTLFGLFYEVASDYGNSIGRPLFWFAINATIAFIEIVFTGGAGLARSAGGAVGWQRDLAGHAPGKNALRALVLVFEYIRNPLRFPDVGGYVVSEHLALSIALTLHGVLSFVFLGFLAIALRRRFKL
jgi:hypothetical protein